MSDELAWGVTKAAHANGLHAKVKWVKVANDLGYTGIYDTGSTTAILRLSETTNLGDWSKGLMPSLALKFLLDGQMSVNILAMPSFTQSESWNFFETGFRSRVDPFTEAQKCERATIQKKLAEGTPHPFANAISVIADRTEDGTWLKSADVRTPYELRFEPAGILGVKGDGQKIPSTKPADGVNWYDQVMAATEELRTANPDDPILDVWALDRPDGTWTLIGGVVLDTPLVTSEFGDKRLFFQHGRVRLDQKYWDSRWRSKA